MTATVWPSPRVNCQADGRSSIRWPAGVALMSPPGSRPELTQSPRCSIAATGPGAPLGGGTVGSTFGGVIARAGAAVSSTASAAMPVARTACFIETAPR